MNRGSSNRVAYYFFRAFAGICSGMLAGIVIGAIVLICLDVVFNGEPIKSYTDPQALFFTGGIGAFYGTLIGAPIGMIVMVLSARKRLHAREN